MSFAKRFVPQRHIDRHRSRSLSNNIIGERVGEVLESARFERN